MFILSCDYANVMSLVTSRLFSACKGEYPIFLSDMNLKISRANCVSNKPSPVSYSLYEKVNRNGLTPKNVRFFIQYGRHNKPVRKRLIANFDTILSDTFQILPDIFRTFVLMVFNKNNYSYRTLYYTYVSLKHAC